MLDKTVEARIQASMNFEEGDRVPIWDYLDNRNIVDYIAPEEADYDRAMVKVYHQLGIDLCRGYGASYKKEDAGQVATDRQSGVVHRISGETRWKVKREIATVEDLRNYQCPASPGTEEKAKWLAAQKAKQEMFAPLTMYVPGGGCGFHSTYDLMGLAFFALAIHDYRDEIERIISGLNRRQVEFARLAAEEKLCPLYFIGDDIAYKGSLMFSPGFLRETFIPALRNCCEPLNNAGIKVIFHSDGFLMEILDDLLDAGIAGLNPIEPAAGMDIGLLKKRYGRNLILVGNLDCSQILPLGRVEEVIQATKACLRQASKGGGHFIGSSSEIVPATPVENIIAFYQTAREFGKYPIKAV